MKYYFITILLVFSTILVGNAKVYNVGSKIQLNNILPTLVAGDTVFLQAQEWNNQSLEFFGNGTELSPIVFAAQTAGRTFLTGDSRIKIYGHFIEVRDLVFQNGNLSGSGHIVEFRKDSKTFAHHCRLTNVTIENYNPANKTTDTKYVSLYGTYNRVDHCSFMGKNNSGATFVVWLDETPDYHLIDHNYFGLRPDLGVNGGETIRIGTSDWESYNSNCTVEYNLFDECDGEIEIISNKSVGNHYRYNTFDNCEGTLTLRHGSDCWVYGNFFLGNEDKNCGGIRIIGPGHRVYNNYLENLRGTSYRAAICLANGVPNSPANRYRQVEDARVGFNTIVNCKEPFAIGAGKDAEKSLPPVNSLIENNLIVAMEGRELVNDYDSADGITWNGIYTDAESIGISAEGFIQTSLPMVLSGKMQTPTSENPVIGAAVPGAFDTISIDIDGQARPDTLKDAGCDQLSDAPKTIFPLTKNDVGANYDIGTSVLNMNKNNYRISIQNGEVKINFYEAGKRTISMYSLNGQLLAQTDSYAHQFKKSVRNLPHLFIMEINDMQSRYAVKLVQ